MKEEKKSAKGNAKGNAKGSAKATVHSMEIKVAFGLQSESANRLAAAFYKSIINGIAVEVAKEVKSLIEGREDAVRVCGVK